jgi:integrase/recombinase XerD
VGRSHDAAPRNPAKSSAQERLKIHVEGYLEKLRISNYSEAGLESKFHRLKFFMRYFAGIGLGGVENLKRRHLPPFIDYLRGLRLKRNGERYKPITIFAIVNAAKDFLRFLHKEEILPIDLGSCLDIRLEEQPLPRVILSETEAETLLSLPDLSTPKGLRDHLMMALMYGVGLRLAEVARLDLYDLDFEEKSIFIRNGKGKKDRLAPMAPGLEATIHAYLSKARPKMVPRRSGQTYLFAGKDKTALTKGTIGAIVTKYFRQAGLKGGPHTLRASFATHLLKHGAGLLYIQRLLGHKNIGTTTIYTRVFPVELRAAILSRHPRSLVPIPKLEMPVRRSSVKFAYLLKLKAEGKTLDPRFYTYAKLSQRIGPGV